MKKFLHTCKYCWDIHYKSATACMLGHSHWAGNVSAVSQNTHNRKQWLIWVVLLTDNFTRNIIQWSQAMFIVIEILPIYFFWPFIQIPNQNGYLIIFFIIHTNIIYKWLKQWANISWTNLNFTFVQKNPTQKFNINRNTWALHAARFCEEIIKYKKNKLFNLKDAMPVIVPFDQNCLHLTF